MPGSFFDSPVPPKLDLAGARSQLFQVPQTPSASSSLYRSISVSRKRARYDTSEKSFFDPEPDLVSPAPLVNTDYRLAGGGESPQCLQFRRETSPELPDYRPNRYREPIDHEAGGLTSRKRSRRDSLFSTQSTSENMINDAAAQPESSSVSWSRAVINVVGKVWDFCWSGAAFRGFYAGGGRGYQMSAPQRGEDENHHHHHRTDAWHSPTEKEEDVFTTNSHAQQTPVPGQFPDEIQRNWVVVRENGFLDETTSPFAKRVVAVPRKKTVGSLHTRRRSAVMPRLAKRTVLSPVARPATPTKIPMLVSPTKRDSPASTEAQRYAAQMRQREREEDASLRRLNKQLQAMIREGKEALGTRVEVDDLDLDLDDD